MIDFDDITKENTSEHNTCSPQTFDYTYMYWSLVPQDNKNKLFTKFGNQQPDADKICKDLFEAKHQFSINECAVVKIFKTRIQN